MLGDLAWLIGRLLMSASLKVGVYAVLMTGFEVAIRKSKEASGSVA